MHSYDSKHFLKIFFSVHKGDTLKVLAWPILGMAVYAALVYYLEIHFLHLDEDSRIKNLNLIHTLLAFVLSMLLVFRTNSAYDRWWEGRKLWGKLVNDCRNFAIKMHTLLAPEDTENRLFFQRSIAYFPHALTEHLSKTATAKALDVDYSAFESGILVHGPLEVTEQMTRRLIELRNQGKLTDEQLIFLDTQLTGFMDVSGGCERIKNTPIPFSYSSFVKKFIVLYVIALPIAYVITIGWLMIPLTVFVFYVLMSLEVIAEEIEDPFNGDENDLPIEKISQNIERHVAHIFEH